jgi:hypothetical protein
MHNIDPQMEASEQLYNKCNCFESLHKKASQVFQFSTRFDEKIVTCNFSTSAAAHT